MNETDLIQAAISVRQNAYARYSKFTVGCSMLTTTGTIFTGCNVENSSYGLSICAERNAIGKMVASGEYDVEAMISGSKPMIEKIIVAAQPLASPCGACRQFIVEFGSSIEVISVQADDPTNLKRWNITELIPDHFEFQK